MPPPSSKPMSRRCTRPTGRRRAHAGAWERATTPEGGWRRPAPSRANHMIQTVPPGGAPTLDNPNYSLATPGAAPAGEQVVADLPRLAAPDDIFAGFVGVP